MNSQAKVNQKIITTEELNDIIIDSIQDIKGERIVKLDLRHLSDATVDYFIICEGNSNTQVKSITDRISLRLKQEAQVLPLSIEGQRGAQWICLDYFSTVVHVFYKDTRRFYAIEELWSDAKFTEYDNL